ncbi:MAG: hypothetical protein CM1200mP28_09060 [Deltaproteobacteria bacterium]|nr:MAG: hypothetical protein CM1200mP28_09060 [Deltaproteobacteria bacterium]
MDNWGGIVLFGRTAMNMGNWFALLHPIIPEKIRGRFFGPSAHMGVNRNCFKFVIHIHLEQFPYLRMYQAVLGIVSIFFNSPHIVLPAYS